MNADGMVPAPAGPGRPQPLISEDFGGEEVTALRHKVARYARRVGLAGERLDDFVLAVNELATNAVRHGGGGGHLLLRLDGDTLACDVSDQGAGVPDAAAAVAGPPARDHLGGRGLFLANELADGLLLTNRVDGLTASVLVCLSDRPAAVEHPVSPAALPHPRGLDDAPR